MKTYSIAKRLNEMGILSAGDKRHPPGQWSQRTVRKLLVSRTYTGEFMRSGIVVPCPQIIDLDTWHRVQERLEHNKQAHIGQPSSQYLLVNYLWCGKCQHRCTTHRTTHRTKAWGQYRCGHMSNKPPYTRYCDAPGIGQARIETAGFAMVWEVLTNPALLLEMGRAYFENLPQPDSDGLKDLERELKELREREEAIIELMKRRLVKILDGQQEIEQDIRPKLGVIREKLRMAGRIIRLPSLQEAEASLREIAEGPVPETYQDRRNILQGIQDLRMEYLDGKLEIAGKVPIRAECAESTTSKGKNRDHRQDVGLGRFLQRAHDPLPGAVRISGVGA